MEEKKNTFIISAFPGCGKTWCFENLKEKYTMLDSDSSKFSWIVEDDKKIRNPDFPNNYIQHIKENLGKVDFIFISTHDTVRKALEENKLMYYLVYPENTKHNKEIWIQRFKDRGSNSIFTTFVSSMWEDWIDEIEMEIFPILVPLSEDNDNGIYLNDELLENIKSIID